MTNRVNSVSSCNFGRDDRIRTCDPHTPSVMRYQAALRPDRRFPGGTGFTRPFWDSQGLPHITLTGDYSPISVRTLATS